MKKIFNPYKNYTYISNNSQKPLPDNNVAGQLFFSFILSLIAGIVAIVGNQLFFKQNKEFEVKSELQKEIIKEQYAFLNRILNFTYKYETTQSLFLTHHYTITTYTDQNTGKITKKDTTYQRGVDSVKVLVPSFISEERKRIEFIEDINEIKMNRSKIDHIVYAEFENILDFLDKNTLPNVKDIESIEKSIWRNKDVQEKWKILTTNLYNVAYSKIY